MNVLSTPPLSRRAVLRGLGTALALPWLDAMAPRRLLGAPADPAARPPVRIAFLYVPNGIQMGQWTPAREGEDFEFPALLEPLTPVRRDVSVLSGLAALEGRPFEDGGNHAPAMGAFLTGVHPRKILRCGISADQLAAERIGHLTRLPSLELSCHRSGRPTCDGYPCVVTSTLSWASPTQPIPAEGSPKAVFERLFAAEAPDRAARNAVRRSILDAVRTEAAALRARVGSDDRRRLDEYLTSVRDVERRIERSETLPAPRLPEGTVAPEDRPPRDFADHVKLLGDLLVLAFRTDATRIATFVVDSEGSNRSYPELGIDSAHHDLSHHGGKADMVEKILRIERHHVALFAALLERFRAVPEGDGTLLDHSLLAYGCALGDGNRHDHQDLPILLAGRGGGTVRPGRHLRYPSQTPLTNLWLAMLSRAGAGAPRLGDSTGPLDRLD